MADYPKFPKITPEMEDTESTFQTGQPKMTAFGPAGPAPTTTIAYLHAGTANSAATEALDKMQQWGDALTDKLASDSVQLRNSVQQDQFGSISIRGRIRLNSNNTNPDTAEATPVTGQIRFNTGTNKFQGYDGTGWRDFH